MKHTIRWMLAILGMAMMFFGPPILGYEEQHHTKSLNQAPGVAFVHTSNTLNISGDMTYIDHHLANSYPEANLQVTLNKNPGGILGTPYNNNFAIQYVVAEGKWAIFNQDGAPMLAGNNFNVLIVTAVPEGFIHIAAPANIFSNWTCIDSDLTSDDPHAVILITQNYTPDGSTGTYNDHAIGVWYSHARNQWCVFNQDEVSMPDGAAFNVLVAGDEWQSYVHTATSANTSSYSTLSTNSHSHNTPNAVIFITQNWNPGGVGGTYNDHTVGLEYIFLGHNWGIANLDDAQMDLGVAFNVLVTTTESASFVHSAMLSNINGQAIWLEHDLLDDNPNGIVFFTHNYNPGGEGSLYHNRPTGMGYNIAYRKHFIFNYDSAGMTLDTAFNVLIPGSDMPAFVHRTTAANTDGNVTYINHILTNAITDTILLVTQNFNPGGGPGVYNHHPIGVWYNYVQERWSIFNQDKEDMDLGPAFNVLVVTSNQNAFVHTATDANIVGQVTCLNHPLANGNPHANMLVTQNWNPGGVGGTYNAHYIGVKYVASEKKWCIFNEDENGLPETSIPEGASFNVLVTGNRLLLPIILR